MPTRKETASLATLAIAAGILAGRNLDKVAAFLGPTAQGIGKMAGAAFGGALKFALQQKEALEDMMVEVGAKDVVQEE